MWSWGHLAGAREGRPGLPLAWPSSVTSSGWHMTAPGLLLAFPEGDGPLEGSTGILITWGLAVMAFAVTPGLE